MLCSILYDDLYYILVYRKTEANQIGYSFSTGYEGCLERILLLHSNAAFAASNRINLENRVKNYSEKKHCMQYDTFVQRDKPSSLFLSLMDSLAALVLWLGVSICIYY